MTANRAASIRARLKQHSARHPRRRARGLQIDIGFGDAVTLAAQPVTYPTLLPDVPAPTLRAYPKATVVAEKLHAVTVLGMTNTRMKDFFNHWVLLLHDTTLDEAELRRAVEATLARRQTALPGARPIGLSDDFANDATKQMQWRAFLKKNKLEPVYLGEVVRTIRERALHFDFAGS